MEYDKVLLEKARKIRLVLTDVDGVLTDTGVYYSERGEAMKRFSIRDGMGVERLRNIGIPTGIITGERSGSVAKRAEKLKITKLYLGISDKPAVLREILVSDELLPDQVAYIGDDYNDLEMLGMVGLSAAPLDAMPEIAASVDFHCTKKGGYGAFRELAELIIQSRQV